MMKLRPCLRTTLPLTLSLATLLVAFTFFSLSAQEKDNGKSKSAASGPKPLKALLVCGGCCHDYEKQSIILRDGIQARANVQIDIIRAEDKGTAPEFPHYRRADWWKGYDIVIHDECAASVKDLPFVKNVLAAHQHIPAVNLHCAMHSFRTGTDDWFKFLGLQSASHGPQEPIAIRFVDPQHPITEVLSDWTTIKEELYNNVNIFDAHPLAIGKQTVKQKDGTTKDVEYVVAWTNEKAGAKSFSTTIGHNNDTVGDARYLDLVTRGLLWACGKLNQDYMVAYTGAPGTITRLSAPIKTEAKPGAGTPPAAKPSATALPPPAAKDATPVTITASSEETPKGNYTWKAADGSQDTRWCAATENYPQWLQYEFEKPQTLTGAKLDWESAQAAYQYKIESSSDGKTWTVLADASKSDKPGPYEHTFQAKDIRLVKVTALGRKGGGWASIREFAVKGEGIKSLAPKLTAAQESAAKQQKTAAQQNAESNAPADPYAKEGNITPAIVKLTPQQEAEILKDVVVPAGFEASLFAAPPAANYPVYLAAAPNGDLFVSSDGNGSLGRNPKRGRILRLRDTNNDGRADQVTEFVKDVDSPRGLVWDHDRLYLVHPPDVSVFIDKDGDGVAEDRKTLIKGIAFGFADRPADHTTNGLSLGMDGWLYIAGGDFGFMDAVGTDGKHLQHRNGGVIRFKPDGSNLEVYSTGTRNILEVAISPTMDIFSRDNTNDGGGWNVRFHHFTGLDDHGYPRLYKNFADEAITPLADYGGGSGCGAVYIDEPGFPAEWANAPFTADWGTNALWKHTVKPKGATYEETEAPKPFIKMTRPTDGDVDAMSRVYLASWKGATFNWAGPDVGYIVQVKPKDFKPEALPDFAKASEVELVKLLESPSYRRRMEAQRELLRRSLPEAAIAGLTSLIADKAKPVAARAAALLLFTHFPEKAKPVAEAIKTLPADPAFDAIVARAVAETAPFGVQRHEGELRFPEAWADEPAALGQLLRAIAYTPADGKTWTRPARKAIYDLALGNTDPVVRHMAIHSLAKTGDETLAFTYVDDSASPGRDSALRALAMMHKAPVVDGLIDRLAKTSDGTLRKGLLTALCRLHFQEGTWKGDSWGTRPDTRGPYYQPEAWEETPKVMVALKEALSKAQPEEAAELVKEMNRNRIQSNEALERILKLAKDDAKLLPDAAAQLANAETIPAEGIPLLVQAAQMDVSTLPPATAANLLANTITALTKTDSADGARVSLGALVALSKIPGAGKEQDTARTTYLASPKLENHHQLLETEAEKVGTPTAQWADMALLSLSARTSGSPESKELSGKALDHGWQDVKRRAQILKAVASLKHNAYADKVLAALDDPDKAVAAAAKNAANAMKLTKKTAAAGPSIATLKPEDVIAQVLKTKGDVALGEQLFIRQTCVACHTTKEDEAQKGPYLGNIAQTYKRPELAQNILDPNKTIAQGFATNFITTKDGNAQMGFVTFESADEVKIRNIAAQEFTIKTKDITQRDKPPISMMPPGLVGTLTIHEFASLLDYLESLVKK